VVAVLAGGLLWGGEAQATITPTPDDAKCTFTNDFIAVCTLKDGSTMCKDNNGKDIDCPTAKLRPIAGLAVAR
jgi:hypothetical protein